MITDISRGAKIAAVLTAFCLTLTACGGDPGPAVEAQDALDTPQSNFSRGMRALQGGNEAGALDLFKRAVALDSEYQQAWIALVDLSTKGGKFAEARNYLKDARKNKPNDDNKLLLNASEVDLLVAEGAPKWQQAATRLYRRSENQIDKKTSDDVKGRLFVLGGGLYQKLGDLEKARAAFAKAIPLGADYRAAATAGLQMLDRLARVGVADAGIAAIAAQPSISRHDLIVLLTQETDLDRQIAEMIGVRERAGELAADGGADYLDDSLAAEIRRIHRFGFRFPTIVDGRFEGEKPVTRAEFAMLVEDIMSTLERDRAMKRKFIGSVSPFKDLSSSNPAFNAFMTAIARGLYPAAIDGNARPNEAISGALAVEALRQLGQ